MNRNKCGEKKCTGSIDSSVGVGMNRCWRRRWNTSRWIDSPVGGMNRNRSTPESLDAGYHFLTRRGDESIRQNGLRKPIVYHFPPWAGMNRLSPEPHCHRGHISLPPWAGMNRGGGESIGKIYHFPRGRGMNRCRCSAASSLSIYHFPRGRGDESGQ